MLTLGAKPREVVISSYFELFTYVFAAHPKCFSTCRRMMETVGKLSGEPLSRGRHCGFFMGIHIENTVKAWK